MALSFYSPANVVVLLGGVVELEGFIDGTFLEITKDAPLYRSKITSDGVTGRIAVTSSNYTIKFTLAQTSESNQKLDKLVQFDNLTRRGSFPIIIKDRSGGSLLFSPTSWIEVIPQINFSNGMESRAWELKAINCAVSIGAGSEESNAVDDLIKTIVAAVPQVAGLL